ncbi:hypothetical protein [Sphingobacterium multivorum]|nr:hypothetical protein [Sphingobacterium multivorum]
MMDQNWKLREEMCMPTTRPTYRYGLKMSLNLDCTDKAVWSTGVIRE